MTNNQLDELLKLVDDALENIKVQVEGEEPISTNQLDVLTEGDNLDTPISQECEHDSTSCDISNGDTQR